MAILGGIFIFLILHSASARESLVIRVAATPNLSHCDLELTVLNNTGKPLVLDFRNSQRFDFYIRDMNRKIIWQWAYERVFADELGKETLQPGGHLRFKAKWPYLRYDGSRVKGGKYWVIGALSAQPKNRYAKLLAIEVPGRPGDNAALRLNR